MPEGRLVNRVRSYSSGTPGRSLNNVRDHHFVIDEPTYNGGPGEEITPADAFLAGVSSCGVLLVETFARQANLPVKRVEASIEGIRNPSDTSRFERVQMRFEVAGVSQAQAEELVARYKNR